MTAKDIISRDTLKRLTTDLARHLLGIDGEAVELLETQNQRVEDRRADLVARMRASSGSEFLLHAEIANNSKADMALRMLRYYTDIRLAGHAGPIRQFLSENRDLRAQIEEAERMLTQIDIERLASYVIGMERGEIHGEGLGLGRGLERGRAIEKRLIVRRLLARMDVAEVAGLLGMSPEDVTRIAAAEDGTDPD